MEAKKTSYANIDSSIIRTGLVLIGGVIVMGVMLSMMEYTNIVPPNSSLDSGLAELADEEVIDMNDAPPPPPPPPPSPRLALNEAMRDEGVLREVRMVARHGLALAHVLTSACVAHGVRLKFKRMLGLAVRVPRRIAAALMSVRSLKSCAV